MVTALIPLLAAVLVAVSTWNGHRRAIAAGGRLTQGYYRGRGLALGLAAGLALDAAIAGITGNNLLGIAIGVTVGLLGGIVTGALWEHRHRDELRPLNPDDLETRRFVLLLALGAIALTLLTVLGSILLSR